MKKTLGIIALSLIFASLCSICSPFASAEGLSSLSAESACLIEAESGRLLYAKNAGRRMPMASTTKIMTAIVALETDIPLDTVISIPREAVGIEGSSIYMTEGERITLHTLLYALLLSSANDAAVAVAIEVAGSVEAFVELMNDKAAELGLSDTHFTNPHGLYDKDHFTTAKDLSHLMAYCMKNESFAQITACKRITCPRGEDGVRVLINHNKLLKTYEGVIGGKTGFTKKSGRCLVSVAERDGLRLVAVTLDAPNDWSDHSALYDFGFSSYERVRLESISVTVPVISGVKDAVEARSEGDISLLLSREHGEVQCRLELPHFLFADVKKGEHIGRAVYSLNGKTVAVADIYACEDIAQQRYRFNLFEWLMRLFGF